MYSNQDFEKSLKIYVGDEEITDYLGKIQKQYSNINRNYDHSTANYKEAVSKVLNTFPIKFRVKPDGKEIPFLYEKEEFTKDKLIEALTQYYNQTESLKYLEFLSQENRNVVFVGPNGAGKTTLIRKLKADMAAANILFISADRILMSSQEFNPVMDYNAFLKDFAENLTYSDKFDMFDQGTYASKIFDYSITLLSKIRMDENERHVTISRSQEIIDEWAWLIQDRGLVFDHGAIKVHCSSPESTYSVQLLSSGEKSILYFLIMTLLYKEFDYYFIDEPENNLNPAVVSDLWDFIESKRPKAIFVYLTHESNFVISRVNARTYWIKKYDGMKWDYEPLKENSELPRDLEIQLLGARKPVLFCESQDETKYDATLYKMMFPEFKIICSGGCDRVSFLVKAYKASGLPYKAIGIIDSDYHDVQELHSLESNKDCPVFHCPSLEVENFLCYQEFVEAVLNLHKEINDPRERFNNLFQKMQTLASEGKEKWIAKKISFSLRKEPLFSGKINSLESVEDLKNEIYEKPEIIAKINNLQTEFSAEFDACLSSHSYNTLLSIIDLKEGVIKTVKEILSLPDYTSDLFDFLKTEKGKELLMSLRTTYFSLIKA